MANYILRDEKGVAKARLTGDAANSVFRNVAGHFREATYTSGKKKMVFDVDTDSVLNLDVRGIGLTIYFWKGDTLVPLKVKHHAEASTQLAEGGDPLSAASPSLTVIRSFTPP